MTRVPRRRRAPERPWRVTTIGGKIEGTYAQKPEAIAKGHSLIAAGFSDAWIRHRDDAAWSDAIHLTAGREEIR